MTTTDDRSAAEISLAEGTWSKQSPARKWEPYVRPRSGSGTTGTQELFGSDVGEGDLVPLMLLGENILLTRVDGKVRAVQDRCAHRGVRFPAQPLCVQKGTVSCWYHGWTYDVTTGGWCDVLTSPQSPVVSIPTYPVHEAQGLVFVYVGDGDPHPWPATSRRASSTRTPPASASAAA